MGAAVAQWEIRFPNQSPIRVEVDGARNLALEYREFEAWTQRPWWKWWERRSLYWQITESVIVHRDAIAGITPRPPKGDKARIGFA